MPSFETEQDDGSHRMRVADRYKSNAKLRKLIRLFAIIQFIYICVRSVWNMLPVILLGEFYCCFLCTTRRVRTYFLIDYEYRCMQGILFRWQIYSSSSWGQCCFLCTNMALVLVGVSMKSYGPLKHTLFCPLC